MRYKSFMAKVGTTQLPAAVRSMVVMATISLTLPSISAIIHGIIIRSGVEMVMIPSPSIKMEQVIGTEYHISGQGLAMML